MLPEFRKETQAFIHFFFSKETEYMIKKNGTEVEKQ